MNKQEAISNRQLNKGTKHREIIGWFFSYLVLYEIISLGINSIVNRYIQVGSIYDSLILYGILFVLFALSFIDIIKCIHINCLIFVLILLFIALTHPLLFNTASLAGQDEVIYLYVGICIMVPVGSSISDFDSLYYCFSRYYWIAIALGSIHLMLHMSNNVYSAVWMSDMTGGYSILPAVLFAIDYAFHKKLAWIWVVIGFVTAFLCGSRGPVLIILVFLIISLLRHSVNLKRKITLVMLIIANIYFYVSGLFFELLNYISKILENNNFRIASLVKILEYDDFSNGRNDIYDKAVYAIWNKPIFGNGLFFDRSFFGYAHNFFLEIFLDFGIIIGAIIIIWLALKSFTLCKNAIKNKDEKKLSIIIMMLCCVFGELMFSSSYICEPLFFALLGMLISPSNYNIQQSAEGNLKDEV